MAPEDLRPRLAPDVEIATFDTRWGTSYSMVKNPRSNRYFRLEGQEGPLAASLDGSRTVAEMVVAGLGRDSELDLVGTTALLSMLRRNGFLDQPFLDVYAVIRSKTTHRETRFGQAVRNLFKTQTVRFPGVPRLTELAYRFGGRFIFTWPTQALFISLLALGPVAFFLDIHSRGFEITGYRVLNGVPLLFVLDLGAIMIHEAGHALAIRHAGRKVLSAGFQLYLGHPAFFIDSADILMAPPRDRIRNAWYGPYMSLVVSGLAAVLVYALPGIGLAQVLFQLSFLNYFGALLNLIPFLELDGYWILTDALQLPDLLPRSLAFFRGELFDRIRRRQKLSRQEWGLTAFAAVALVFTVISLVTSYFLLGPLIVRFVSAMWRAGAITRMLLIVLAALVLGPLVQGVGRSLGWAWGWIRYWAHRTRFRAQRRWRVEAGELIDRLPVLSQLPMEAVNELAGRVRLRRYPRGRTVVRQGEPGNGFFVVRSGEVTVVEERPDGSEREIRTLGRGASFGEVAVLERIPRTATVRALKTCEVFEIAGGTFEALLGTTLVRAEGERTVQQLSAVWALPPFRHLSESAAREVADAGAWVNVPAGTPVVEEGQPGEDFLVVVTGRFSVEQGGRPIRTLGPGDHFGELALLRDTPRTATVRALTPGRVFRLGREGFHRLIADSFLKGMVVPHEPIGSREVGGEM